MASVNERDEGILARLTLIGSLERKGGEECFNSSFPTKKNRVLGGAPGGKGSPLLHLFKGFHPTGFSLSS